MLNIKLNWSVSLIILKMESTEKPVIKRDKNSNKKEPLNKYYGEAKYEIGIDEAGEVLCLEEYMYLLLFYLKMIHLIIQK